MRMRGHGALGEASKLANRWRRGVFHGFKGRKRRPSAAFLRKFPRGGGGGGGEGRDSKRVQTDEEDKWRSVKQPRVIDKSENPPEDTTTSGDAEETRSEGTFSSEEDAVARLIIVQITDVYTLDNFASLKTLLQDLRKNRKDKVISMLTGDFLSPYLLSTRDHGRGMMNALAKTPIDYLTWGNHEADIDHETVCQHVRNFPGVWINTNMQSHDAMEFQKPFDIVEVSSPDGTNTRRIGLVALLSNDPSLYEHFPPDKGAFGGATIDDPWETLGKYVPLLYQEHSCHMVLPLQHVYEKDDHKTCREFNDIPLILSGHDHHVVQDEVNGTLLLKPGQDGIRATCVEIEWSNASQKEPTIRHQFLQVSDWAPDPELQEENRRAYDVLLPLERTELIPSIPAEFRPLSSSKERSSVCTAGKLVCSMLKSALNCRSSSKRVNAVLLMGGNIRGNKDYEDGAYFSLQDLEAEILSDEVIGIVSMPGWLLEKGILDTHSKGPISGYLQYDTDVQEEKQAITMVDGQPLDPDGIYTVATKISDLTNGQCTPWTRYYKEHPALLPNFRINIRSTLLSFIARNLWERLWESVMPPPPLWRDMDSHDCDDDDDTKRRFRRLDHNQDGELSVDDILYALGHHLGLAVDESEPQLAETMLRIAANGSNDDDAPTTTVLTLNDLRKHRQDFQPSENSQKWKAAFAPALANASSSSFLQVVG